MHCIYNYRTHNEDLWFYFICRYICRQFHLTAQRARWSGHLKRDGYLLQEIGLVSEIIFALSFCSYRPIYYFLYIFRLKVTKKNI